MRYGITRANTVRPYRIQVLRMHRLLIAAPYSGSGKTTFTLGLIGALRQKGLSVAPFKVGPDYIDTAYHQRAAGAKAINLDTFLLGREGMRRTFAQYAHGPDIAVVEGVMGLFDGVGATRAASSAQVAALLDMPVLLVVNGKGMAASAAALVRGFASHDPNVNIAGAVFNNVSESHYQILRGAVEAEAGVKCLGYLPRREDIAINSRHLGILPEGELEDADKRIERMAELVSEHIDVHAIIDIAAKAPPLAVHKPVTYEQKPCTLAVARDAAFNFYYEDSLDTLRAMGAELVFFSPLKDAGLPRCDGIYIGGGFPEIFAGELRDNRAMRGEIQRASRAGMPIYGECGGYLYLARSIMTGDEEYAMCGALPVSGLMEEKLSGHFGYVRVTLQAHTPLGRAGSAYSAHEFHHSVMRSESGAYLAEKASDGREWPGGSVQHNTFGAYAHVNFAGEPDLAANFLEACRAFR